MKPFFTSSKLRALCVLAVHLLLLNRAHAILDTNLNGISDLWEKQYNSGNLFPNTFLTTADPDNDGWDNITEAAAGTDPFSSNLADGIVNLGITRTTTPGFFKFSHPTILGKSYQMQGSSDLLSWYNIGEAHLAFENTHSSFSGVTTTTGDPAARFFWRSLIADVDSDNDGLSDYEEIILGTNPNYDDTDNDGIKDKTELLRALDPLNADTDDDGLTDGFEDSILTLPTNPDTDSDTISDGEEIASGTNPLLPDTDGDGLTDAQEKNLHTNPLWADTDNDGVTDGAEIANNTNPLTNDTDQDGITDNLDITPLANDAIADPDGANLPTALTTVSSNNLRARWDFNNYATTTGVGLFPPTATTTVGNINVSGTGATFDGPDDVGRTVNGMPHSCLHFLTGSAHAILPAATYLHDLFGQTWSMWIQFTPNALHATSGIRTWFSYGNNANLSGGPSHPILHTYFRNGANPTLQVDGYQASSENYAWRNYVSLSLPAHLDNGDWHHISFSRIGVNYTLTIDGSPNTASGGININGYDLNQQPWARIGKFKPNNEQPHPTIVGFDNVLSARIDRLRIYGRVLTNAENLSLYNHDIDRDGLFDRTEARFRIWRDHNNNLLREPGETYFHLNPFLNDPMITDHDGDGITSVLEQNSTPPTRADQADTDGDLMPDGWETQNGLNPSNPTDANLDTDNDGLTTINEYRFNTNPNSADTDNDSRTDVQEVNGPDGNPATDDGSNPNDPSDNGVRPPAAQLLTLKLGVGDRSISHSEDYVLHVNQIQPDGSEKRIYTLRSGGFGVYAEEIRSFPKQYTYTFQLDWQGTNNTGIANGTSNPEGADFDYHMVVEPQGTPSGHILIDSYDPKAKTVDSTIKLLDPQDINPTDDNDDNVTTFLTTHEPKRVLLLKAAILVDANRDGQFSAEDEEKITEQRPWRFWINEDNDRGEFEGKDMPAEPQSADSKDSRCNGIRDLVDFFPVQLKIQQILHFFPAQQYGYYILQDYDLANVPALAGKSGSGYMEWNEADPSLETDAANSSASYLRKIDTAFACEKLQVHPVRQEKQDAKPLTQSFLHECGENKGLLLIEAKNRTTKPLKLIVTKKNAINSENVISIILPVSYSQVTKMFRYRFVSPAAADLTVGDIPASPDNWPDGDRNGKHFVFVHGYNVNPDQSKAWGSELFKKMFWSGSNAKFSVFAWYGYQSQIANSVSPNYQINLVNAFASSHSLKQYIDLLPGEKTVAAHSMGNVIMGSAMHDWVSRPKNYIMLNSAAAKECYDEAEASDLAQEALMIHPWWKNYMKEVRASEWHNRVWPVGDERAKLTWRGRLKNVINNGGQTQVYNFYSTGEEVLNNPTENDPDLSSDNPSVKGTFTWLKANKTWAMQEKRKGWGMTGIVHTSNYGGWFPNLFDFTTNHHILLTPEPEMSWRMRYPTEIPNSATQNGFGLFVASLMEKPFFDHSKHATLYDEEKGEYTTGSNYAKQWANTLISEMIPCTSLAAGRNPFSFRANSLPLDKDINMHEKFMTDEAKWPYRNDKHDQSENLPRAWCHSDIREVAFAHTWKAFAKIVEIGDLSQQ